MKPAAGRDGTRVRDDEAGLTGAARLVVLAAVLVVVASVGVGPVAAAEPPPRATTLSV